MILHEHFEQGPMGGVIIGEAPGGWSVQILAMVFNDRLVLAGIDEHYPHFEGGYRYGWCYSKGGPAILAARLWDPEAEGEPVGWIKRVHSGQRPAGQRYVRLVERLAGVHDGTW